MKLFESVFADGVSVGGFLSVMAVALFAGLLLTFLIFRKTDASKSFFLALSLLPITVSMVIMLVNGNIGAGVAVAGAFTLIRFRSASGTAKEIALIFIATASGLALGMGYLAYGILFLLIAGGALSLLSALPVWEKKENSLRDLEITVPEDLDYTGMFDDLFERYTKKALLLRVKTVHMGSMFRLSYRILMKDGKKEKEMIDALRCRNGNLEISLRPAATEASDL